MRNSEVDFKKYQLPNIKRVFLLVGLYDKDEQYHVEDTGLKEFAKEVDMIPARLCQLLDGEIASCDGLRLSTTYYYPRLKETKK